MLSQVVFMVMMLLIVLVIRRFYQRYETVGKKIQEFQKKMLEQP
jgi:membrane protein implicated in regulation of membrane protease activity